MVRNVLKFPDGFIYVTTAADLVPSDHRYPCTDVENVITDTLLKRDT